MNIQNNLPPIALVDIPPGYLNIMGYVDESEVNGPGCRAVVWVQGCHRACPGCFNPDSWSFEINQLTAVDILAQKILSNPRNEGVTFSGGEPFWQASALTELAHKVKAAGLNVMSFTGFTLEQLQEESAPLGAQDLLDQLDILIDGPFIEILKIHSPDSPVASSNQRIHIFNPAFKDNITWASNQLEIHVLPDGRRILTGYHGQLSRSRKNETHKNQKNNLSQPQDQIDDVG
ncbi:4Fe-4S single cluster domain-containing protein [Acaryochloris sp. IP29b_bin.137]|uniref:4Fe-4S single cluster domain-containing protein n=1 Tax=Acaryochloris sp. IP29b_bin.137 TaxID=2969217 RepID=UPI002619C8C8|nr:4Fe-4S single cluster domain-containing protein [Acaryochloris sp. IP29b_bin.137]